MEVEVINALALVPPLLIGTVFLHLPYLQLSLLPNMNTSNYISVITCLLNLIHMSVWKFEIKMVLTKYLLLG